MKQVPAASGMVIFGDSIYLVGDNSPLLFQLNTQYEITRSVPLIDGFSAENITIPKAEKPDFEALEMVNVNGKEELIVLGSGSLSPQRDLLVWYNPHNHSSQTSNLTTFYNKLRNHTALKGKPLNLEAIAIQNERLILLNRGQNILFQFLTSEFISYLQNPGSTFPKSKVLSFKLPELDGVPSGFSGATFLPESNKIVFTASVENTPNPIDDGTVLGSYVGIIDLDDRKPKAACSLISNNGKVLPVKVESVSVVSYTNGKAEVLLVTDSDGGSSEMLKTMLWWNE